MAEQFSRPVDVLARYPGPVTLGPTAQQRKSGRWAMFALFVGSLLTALWGIWLIVIDVDVAILIIGVVILLVGAVPLVLTIKSWMQPSGDTLVTLDERGFAVHNARQHTFFEWRNVGNFHIESDEGGGYVVFEHFDVEVEQCTVPSMFGPLGTEYLVQAWRERALAEPPPLPARD